MGMHNARTCMHVAILRMLQWETVGCCGSCDKFNRFGPLNHAKLLYPNFTGTLLIGTVYHLPSTGIVPWSLECGGAAHTVRARCICFNNLPVTIVLICCRPVRCRVAELVPHFTLHTLRTALYMLSLGLKLSNTCLCLGFEPVPLSSTTAAVQMSGFLLLFWVPPNTLVITKTYSMR